VFPSATDTDTGTDVQIKTIAAEQTKFIFQNDSGVPATGSSVPASDLLLATAAPGDVVLEAPSSNGSQPTFSARRAAPWSTRRAASAQRRSIHGT
jgi:hypothetical protein